MTDSRADIIYDKLQNMNERSETDSKELSGGAFNLLEGGLLIGGKRYPLSRFKPKPGAKGKGKLKVPNKCGARGRKAGAKVVQLEDSNGRKYKICTTGVKARKRITNRPLTAWQKFIKANAGQGITMKQLAKAYHAHMNETLTIGGALRRR